MTLTELFQVEATVEPVVANYLTSTGIPLTVCTFSSDILVCPRLEVRLELGRSTQHPKRVPALSMLVPCGWEFRLAVAIVTSRDGQLSDDGTVLVPETSYAEHQQYLAAARVRLLPAVMRSLLTGNPLLPAHSVDQLIDDGTARSTTSAREDISALTWSGAISIRQSALDLVTQL